jgi:hypothetical protein
MRAGASRLWRIATAAAFGVTATVAVIMTRGAPISAALASDGAGARAPASARTAPATPHCALTGLRVSLGAGTRAAGSVTRYALEFTNVSGAACTLAGYPEVAAYRGDGVQVGTAAARGHAAAAGRVLLAPGHSAYAVLDIAAPVARCRPVRASGLSVTAPGEAAARYVKRPLTTCAARAARGQPYLLVQAVQPGGGPGPGGGAGALAAVRTPPGGARRPSSGAS